MRTNMFDKAALRMSREINAARDHARLADECHGYDLDGNPLVKCPQCNGADDQCLLCEGGGKVTACQASEWHTQNPSIADEIKGSFEVDGEPVDDLKAFLADNDFDEDTLLTMSILRVGDSMHLGGGAAPLVTLKRIGE